MDPFLQYLEIETSKSEKMLPCIRFLALQRDPLLQFLERGEH